MDQHLTPREVRARQRLARMYMAGLVVFGSGIMIAYTYQNKTTYIDDSGVERKWNHPFFTSII